MTTNTYFSRADDLYHICIYVAERKRFYQDASVYREDTERGWYGVKLDHRHLRTPLRHPFLVPTEGLALAVAEEWERQEEGVLRPSLMHVTSLCNTVLDKGDDRDKEESIRVLLGYLSTDTLRYGDLVA